MHPTTLAMRTAATRVRHTTRATVTPTLSKKRSFKKFAAAKVIPHKSATRISFHTTRNPSPNSISPKDSPRIMVTLAWPPAFPPVSMSMGI